MVEMTVYLHSIRERDKLVFLAIKTISQLSLKYYLCALLIKVFICVTNTGTSLWVLGAIFAFRLIDKTFSLMQILPAGLKVIFA